jgi:membrane-associated phospholipid phosphatase
VRNQVTPRVQPALARLALLVVGYVVALGVVYFLSVHTVRGRRLDDASLRGAIAVRPLVDDTVERILDVVSVASLLAAVAVVAAIALVRLARFEGLVAVGILAGSNVTTWLLKNVLLDRPDFGLDEIAPATLNSLPSGHATAAFSAVAALLVVTWRSWREVIATVGAGYAALTGVATMMAGWHRAADSVAAFLVVGAWAAVGAAVLVVADTPARGGTGREPRPRPVSWLVRSALASLALGAALATVFLLASPVPGSTVGSAVAFLAGCLFVVGGAAAVTVGLVEGLRIADGGLAGPATER